jgi:hypothetical protein
MGERKINKKKPSANKLQEKLLLDFPEGLRN